MKSEIVSGAFFTIWLFMMVFTYGHAYNHFEPRTCSQKDDVSRSWCEGANREAQGINPLFEAAFWPMYWSVELQKK